jgi:FKBP-type peptidyl-prolyl cis-trans isomerase FkpA
MFKSLIIASLLASPAWAEDKPKADSPNSVPIEVKPVEKPAEKPAEKKAEKKDEFKNDDERIIYALGVVLTRNLGSFALSGGEVKFLAMGLKDAVEGKPLKVDMGTWGPQINELQKRRAAKRAEADEAAAKGEKEKSKEFLGIMAKEKGAQASPSGLVYFELKKGKGESPKATDTVKVHYEGTLINGKVFDSSYKRNAPIDFGLNQVIPCWTEGVQKMKPGGKAKLICPSDIAYGDQGHPPDIPGGATLVFTVELLEVKK